MEPQYYLTRKAEKSPTRDVFKITRLPRELFIFTYGSKHSTSTNLYVVVWPASRVGVGYASVIGCLKFQQGLELIPEIVLHSTTRNDDTIGDVPYGNNVKYHAEKLS